MTLLQKLGKNRVKLISKQIDFFESDLSGTDET